MSLEKVCVRANHAKKQALPHKTNWCSELRRYISLHRACKETSISERKAWTKPSVGRGTMPVVPQLTNSYGRRPPTVGLLHQRPRRRRSGDHTGEFGALRARRKGPLLARPAHGHRPLALGRRG